MIYRQLPVIEKSQPIAPKYEIKPGAQHHALRHRKLIYKNIMASDSGLSELCIQMRTTYLKVGAKPDFRCKAERSVILKYGPIQITRIWQ